MSASMTAARAQLLALPLAQLLALPLVQSQAQQSDVERMKEWCRRGCVRRGCGRRG